MMRLSKVRLAGSSRKALASGFVLAALAAASFSLAAEPAQASTTFTVNNTVNAGNGVCDASGCTLHEAITAANSTPGADTINFNIPDDPNVPGNEVKTISLASPLPSIDEQVTIDGYSQPGSSENTSAAGTNAKPLIELNGQNAGSAGSGLIVGTSGSGTVVKGLVINRFGAFGVRISGDGSKLEGNFIGTDPSGHGDLGNGNDGVDLNGASNSTVGGATPEARNLISGNGGDGVTVGFEPSANDKVQGNLVGTKKDGFSALGNSASGVDISGSSGNLVGGTAPGEANIIAFNNIEGVAIFGDGSTGNRVLGNSIFSNGGLGIDLAPGNDADGPTLNDKKDPDLGANNLQNFPVLSTATTSSSGETAIAGKLNSRSRKSFTLQFFSGPAGSDEGKKLIGQKTVKTSRRGNVSFTFSPSQSVPVGEVVTATATDASGNTSEFSAPKSVAAS